MNITFLLQIYFWLVTLIGALFLYLIKAGFSEKLELDFSFKNIIFITIWIYALFQAVGIVTFLAVVGLVVIIFGIVYALDRYVFN